MRKAKRKKRTRRLTKSLLRRAMVYGACACVILVAVFTFYCISLDNHIEERFSGRRWSIPSKVFSDTTILFPGQVLNRDLFLKKLHRLGYREIDQPLTREGEMRVSPGALDIFLHVLHAPHQTRPSFPLKIRFAKKQIRSLERLDNHEPLTLLELEPEEIMSFFGPERERRHLVALSHVPPHIINAILAAEDIRFYHHHGVDPLGILRAAYVNLRHFGVYQGGSTITQQLAKSYFLTPARTLSRKVKELLIAVMLEARYDKNEILEIYLNEIYLGQRGSVSINGIGEASFFYFGKPVSELSLAEAAVLAGLIKAPNHYSPHIDKERCRSRRDQVLHAMYTKQLISGSELAAALQSPLGTISYTAYRKQAPYFIDYLTDQLNALYPPEALTGFGLSIYTTLDTQVQEAAETALEKGLSRLERSHSELQRNDKNKRLQGAILVIQPKTGYILAMVGGRDYTTSQFNRVTQAHRQPGSAFKPFVFLSALDSFTPLSLLANIPLTYHIDGTTWEPSNFEPIPDTQVSLRRALAQSINLATIDCAIRVGLDHVVATAREFEFSTPLEPYPSLALGAFEMIPLELARSYCAFAADGVLPYPLALKEVLDENNQPLERRHTTIKRVTSPAKAFMMSSLLRDAVENGTARSLKKMGISFPVAGKTGTTNNFRDAWFVGYTPDILALVWVGFDNGDSLHASGARAALPIWADLLNALPEYVGGGWFQVPPGVVNLTVCKETGQQAVAGACPETIEEFFLAENAPADRCSVHQRMSPFRQLFQHIKDAINRP